MLEIKNVTRIYKPKKGEPVRALDNVSLKFPDTGLVFVLGKSGSGKSTLLNVMGGLDKLDEGEIIIKGKSSKDFTQADFDSYRNTYLGFIFQEYNILNEFNVGQNIALAIELQGRKASEEEINRILEEVDLVGFGKRKPNEMSGGQKQRIAIARALVKNPDIIMADEPTGALDSKTGLQVFDTLKKLSKTKLVIVVSHDREFAELYGDRVIEFKDGKIISDIEKYLEDSEVKNDNVSVIDNKFIQIKQGYKLTQKDVELINDYLQNNSAIISVDEMANRDVKKFARINDLGQKESFKDTDENEIISTTSGFKLIKSRLPLKASFKMGASSLKTKPFRLFITILLSFVAFAFFGIVDTMNAYERNSTAIESVTSSNTTSITMTKEYADYKYSGMQESDIIAIEQKVGKKSVKIINAGFNVWDTPLNNSFSDSSAYDPYQAASVSGWADINDVDYPIIAGRKPVAKNEAVITKCHYNEFLKKGYSIYYYNTETSTYENKKYTIEEINTPEKFIAKDILLKLGMNIKGEDIEVKVVGIIDTGFDTSKYKASENAEYSYSLADNIKQMAFSAEIQNSLNTAIFRTKEFIDERIEELKANQIYSMGIEIYKKDSDNLKISDTVTGMNKGYSVEYLESKNATIVKAPGVGEKLAKNQILLPINSLVEPILNKLWQTSLPEDADKINMLNSIYDGCKVYEWNGENNVVLYKPELIQQAIDANYFSVEKKTQYVTNHNVWPETESTIEIVGYYVYEENYDNEKWNCLVGSKEFLEENASRIEHPYSSICFNVSDDKKAVTNIIEEYFEKSLDYANFVDNPNATKIKISCASLSVVGMVDDLISNLNQIFLIVAIICAVFSALLLANFITVSISYKKREIGVLRAIGARGVDVYSVFFNESMIIAGINYVIALIAAIFTVNYINNLIINDYSFPLKLMSFGIRQIVLMLLISVATAAISTFLPVFMTARKRPSEAIRTA